MPAPPPGHRTLSVNPEQLLGAARTVTAEHGSLLAEFTASDATTGQSITGWVGQSHTALAGIAARWVKTTAALAARLHRLGAALHTAGVTFAEMDAAHAAALSPPPRGHHTP